MPYAGTPRPAELEVNIVNAFTDGDEGGNPAGVVLDADGLAERQMQAIAAKAGLSETVFVSRSRREGAKLDFFTPTRRIAHCGHATIAAFGLPASLGRIADGATTKETVHGPRRIVVGGGKVFMEQSAPRYRRRSEWSAVTPADVLASLGLGMGRFDPRFTPQVVDTGNAFMLVAVRQAEDLAHLRPHQAAIEAISEALGLVGFYVFAPLSGTPANATARMFAPRYGIAEESATGMAAGPLACVLHDFFGRSRQQVIEQGAYMTPPSPSRIEVSLSLDNGRILGLFAGGSARLVRSIPVSVPAAGEPVVQGASRAAA
jgi:PhzF family phenazine biosynthesis protein